MRPRGQRRRRRAPAGNPQRLVGVVVAHGGVATFDQISEAIWPGDDVEASRARLRNVLLRLRRGVGDVVARSGSGVRLAADVGCDLVRVRPPRQRRHGIGAFRSGSGRSPRRAGGRLADGPFFGDFEYEEWAMATRRSVEQRLIGLLDLLSVRQRTPATCRWPSRSPNGPSVSTATPTRGTCDSPSCSRCKVARQQPSPFSRMPPRWLRDRRCGSERRRSADANDLMRRAANS